MSYYLEGDGEIVIHYDDEDVVISPGANNSSDVDPEPIREIANQTCTLPVLSTNEANPLGNLGAVRVYENGDYRLIEGSESSPMPRPGLFGSPRRNTSVDVPYAKGRMISDLNGQPVNGFKVNGRNYMFNDSETIIDIEGNYKKLSYSDIPGDEFNAIGNYDMYVKYDNNTTSNNCVTVSVPFMYDLTKGTIHLYENGKYAYRPVDPNDTPVIVGTLLPGIDASMKIVTSGFDYSTYTFTEHDEDVIDNGELVHLRFCNPFWSNAQSLSYINHKGSITVKTKTDEKFRYLQVFPYISGRNMEFKMDKIRIDRSLKKNFANQVPYEQLEVCLRITNENGTDVGYNPNVMNFYIGEYKPGANFYQGNAISIVKLDNDTKLRWRFDKCTWVKGATDVIHVAYGDNIDCASIEVEIYDSDENNIPLRGFKAITKEDGYFIEGCTYPITDFFETIPEDFVDSGKRIWRCSGKNMSYYSGADESLPIKRTFEEEFTNAKIYLYDSGTMNIYIGWYSYGDVNHDDLYGYGFNFDINVEAHQISIDLEDGDLKIYENGWCRQGNGPLKQLFTYVPDTDFHYKLTTYIYYSAYGSYTYSYEKEFYFDVGEMEEWHSYDYNAITRFSYHNCQEEQIEEDGVLVTRKYITIPGELFEYCDYHYIYIEGEGLDKHYSTLDVSDRNFIISFNTPEITIDRSNIYNFRTQMNAYHGTNIVDYINIPKNSKIKYNEDLLNLYLNNIKRNGGKPVRGATGNAVIIGSLGFGGSTWRKNQSDTVHMSYGYIGTNTDSDLYHKPTYSTNTITVKTIDSSSNVYLRGISDSGFNHKFNVGQEYTIRDLFGFYPTDMSGFQLNMSQFTFKEYDTSALEFKVVSPQNPTTWKAFYDDYMRVKVLREGIHQCYVSWRTSDGGMGGKMLITIRGVTDGTGKSSSSSGPLNGWWG